MAPSATGGCGPWHGPVAFGAEAGRGSTLLVAIDFLKAPWRAVHGVSRFAEQTILTGLLFTLGRSSDERWSRDPLISSAHDETRATFID
jgi:hypothetical protein